MALYQIESRFLQFRTAVSKSLVGGGGTKPTAYPQRNSVYLDFETVYTLRAANLPEPSDNGQYRLLKAEDSCATSRWM